MQGNVIEQNLSISVQIKNQIITYVIGLEHYNFLDLDIPAVFISFGTDKGIYESSMNFFTSFTFPSLEQMKDILPLPQTATAQSSSDPPFPKSSLSPEESFWNDFISGAWLGIGITSIALLLDGVISAVTRNTISTTATKILGIIAKITTYVTFGLTIITTLLNNLPNISIGWIVGLTYGPLVVFMVYLVLASAVHAIFGKHGASDKAKNIIQAIGLGFTLAAIFDGVLDIIQHFSGLDLSDEERRIEFDESVRSFIAFLIVAAIGTGLQERVLFKNTLLVWGFYGFMFFLIGTLTALIVGTFF